MGTFNLPSRRPPQTSMAVIGGQCESRFFDPSQDGMLGDYATTRPLQHDPAAFSGIPHSGCVRFEDDCPDSSVHVMVPRPRGSGSGRFVEQVGPSNVSVPTGPTSEQSSSSRQNPGDQSNLGVPSLVNVHVVAAGHGVSCGPASSLASLQASSRGCHRAPPGPLLPRPLSGGAHFRGHYAQSIGHFDLNQGDLDFLSGHLADGTANNYGYAFKHFASFCESLKADPFTCAPSVLVKYIRHKFEQGSSYRTINCI